MPEKFQFHVGYYDHLHADPSVNFEMNRWITYLGTGALHSTIGKTTGIFHYRLGTTLIV